jgi:hypothetical protein
LNWKTISIAFTATCAALFGPARAEEQAVIVQFHYGLSDLGPLHDLEDKLSAAIKSARVGEFDGDEVATDGSNGRLYMYGPSADAIFEAVGPILKAADFMKGAEVRRRYGPPNAGAKEVTVQIPDDGKP